MPIPTRFKDCLAAPAIVAPMFLVSGPDLVVECCRAGLVGTFPSLNQRTTEGYEEWLAEIETKLAALASSGRKIPPFGVNLIVHRTNPRLQADLEVTIRHKVPLVITSLGAAHEVIDAVHAYGGLVFHDVINAHHARKAAAAGVDGLIAVCAGAGGHAGTWNPFALVSEIRSFFDKTVILAGAINTGGHIAAAQVMGADFAYIGTRFIATNESMAAPGFKTMLLECNAKDIEYTAEISGVPGNFLRPSIEAAGRDTSGAQHSISDLANADHKAWKDIWSAGQGVGGISDVLPAADLCARLAREYRAALASASSLAPFESALA